MLILLIAGAFFIPDGTYNTVRFIFSGATHIVFANIPLLYIGAKYVFKATAHYKKKDGSAFTSDVIGSDKLYWDERK